MKKKFLSVTIIVILLFCSNGLQAQDATKDLDQLKLAQKYLVGTWQEVTSNDTVNASEAEQHGNVIVETDYIIVNGEKSIKSFWTYSYKPERNNFYIFAATVSAGCGTGIGSFTAENKWCQKAYTLFNLEKFLFKDEFVYDTPTSFTSTTYNAEGVKVGEAKYSKVK